MPIHPAPDFDSPLGLLRRDSSFKLPGLTPVALSSVIRTNITLDPLHEAARRRPRRLEVREVAVGPERDGRDQDLLERARPPDALGGRRSQDLGEGRGHAVPVHVDARDAAPDVARRRVEEPPRRRVAVGAAAARGTRRASARAPRASADACVKIKCRAPHLLRSCVCAAWFPGVDATLSP